MRFIGTAVGMAWATLQYLVFYRFVIGVAPATSVAAQTLVGTRQIRLPFAWPAALLVGAATSPRASAIGRGLAVAAGRDAGPLVAVTFLVGAHFLTPYYLLLTGPLLGKDVLLSHVIGAGLCLAITRVLWRAERLAPEGDAFDAADDRDGSSSRSRCGSRPCSLRTGDSRPSTMMCWPASALHSEARVVFHHDTIRKVSTLPAAEAAQELLAKLGWDGLLRQATERLDSVLHLPQVHATVAAHPDVELETHLLREGQPPLEVVRHQLRQLPTREHV